jgi:hypothetical protein
MLHIFRAFLWMRWRVLANTLERTGARDALDRLSLATEKLAPLIAIGLLVPSAIGLFVLGLIAGFGVATGSWAIPFQIVRFFLLGGTILTLLGPIILPARDAASAVRLLLLPISRVALYLSQLVGSLADPWILLMVPVLVAVPIGLAIGLQFLTAIAALAAGVLFLLFVIGLTSLASSTIHLLLRNRRRGDIVMLLIVVVLPAISMVPSLMASSRGSRKHMTAAERHALPPSRVERIAAGAFPYVPSELYRTATVDMHDEPASGATRIAGLAIVAAIVQTLAFGAFRRVLDMPVSMGARRAGAFGGIWVRVIPGLSPGASAVAWTQFRLATRTPRGRAMIVTPVLMFAIFGVAMARTGGLPVPGLQRGGGVGIAAFGAFIALMSVLQFAVNQFAVDRAGFTRQMLLPLTLDELLAGKAVGNALIVAGPALVCWLAAAVMFPGLDYNSWSVIPIAWVAVYLLLAPIAAALSAVFPKSVDLNSIGNSSNAHQAAGLLGVLTFAGGGVPCILLALLAVHILHRPSLAPVFVAIWAAIMFVVARLLFIPVRRLIERRCESLIQYSRD